MGPTLLLAAGPTRNLDSVTGAGIIDRPLGSLATHDTGLTAAATALCTSNAAKLEYQRERDAAWARSRGLR
ncbi:hypothetical protein [Leekyejoonella antrihumi]|uniref:Uncharacterized protein n=1 Tax=Leekyejoonella antrihumi TaxID=1660198 RepID=A0A563DW17_9MICO|nr:hypothetical protein [Leekyejoonella antrihumi]TWP34468.1 hypothetical protein FGL98_17275 [Leekyejoonella antrihumi]